MIKKLKECFSKRQTSATPLPKATLGISFTLLLVNSTVITTVFSYLPQFIKSIGTSEVDTGYYVGLIASSFFIGKAVCCLFWGYASDVKGKKNMAVISGILLGLTTLAFGFSTNFYWAFVTRFLQGCSMGLIVILKALVRNECDNTNMTLAMSILLSSYALGLLIGPSVAGFLVFPAEQFPQTFSQDGIFGKYEILLPNLIISVSCIGVTIIAFIFLRNDKRTETSGEHGYLVNLKDEKHQYMTFDDAHLSSAAYGKEEFLNISIVKNVEVKKESRNNIHYFKIIEPEIGLTFYTEENMKTQKSLIKKITDSKLIQVLRTKMALLCSLLYGIYSLVASGFDELFPVYLATSRDYKGVGFSPSKIGISLLGVCGFIIIVQTTVLTVMFRWSLITMVVTMPLLPLVYGITNTKCLWTAILIYLFVCRIAYSECLITVSILLNNSVDFSLLGSVNGLGMTVSCIGRGIAPTLFGSIYSWSLSNIKEIKANENPLGFPFNQYLSFFALSFVALVTAVLLSKVPESLNNQSDDKVTQKTSDEISEENIGQCVTTIGISSFKL